MAANPTQAKVAKREERIGMPNGTPEAGRDLAREGQVTAISLTEDTRLKNEAQVVQGQVAQILNGEVSGALDRVATNFFANVKAGTQFPSEASAVKAKLVSFVLSDPANPIDRETPVGEEVARQITEAFDKRIAELESKTKVSAGADGPSQNKGPNANPDLDPNKNAKPELSKEDLAARAAAEAAAREAKFKAEFKEELMGMAADKDKAVSIFEKSGGAVDKNVAAEMQKRMIDKGYSAEEAAEFTKSILADKKTTQRMFDQFQEAVQATAKENMGTWSYYKAKVSNFVVNSIEALESTTIGAIISKVTPIGMIKEAGLLWRDGLIEYAKGAWERLKGLYETIESNDWGREALEIFGVNDAIRLVKNLKDGNLGAAAGCLICILPVGKIFKACKMGILLTKMLKNPLVMKTMATAAEKLGGKIGERLVQSVAEKVGQAGARAGEKIAEKLAGMTSSAALASVKELANRAATKFASTLRADVAKLVREAGEDGFHKLGKDLGIDEATRNLIEAAAKMPASKAKEELVKSLTDGIVDSAMKPLRDKFVSEMEKSLVKNLEKKAPGLVRELGEKGMGELREKAVAGAREGFETAFREAVEKGVKDALRIKVKDERQGGSATVVKGAEEELGKRLEFRATTMANTGPKRMIEDGPRGKKDDEPTRLDLAAAVNMRVKKGPESPNFLTTASSGPQAVAPRSSVRDALKAGGAETAGGFTDLGVVSAIQLKATPPTAERDVAQLDRILKERAAGSTSGRTTLARSAAINAMFGNNNADLS